MTKLLIKTKHITYFKVLHTLLFITDGHHQVKDVGELVEMKVIPVRAFCQLLVKLISCAISLTLHSINADTLKHNA